MSDSVAERSAPSQSWPAVDGWLSGRMISPRCHGYRRTVVDGLRLRWRGPVYRISALAKQGTEALCRDVMKRLEELGIQEPEGDSG